MRVISISSVLLALVGLVTVGCNGQVELSPEESLTLAVFEGDFDLVLDLLKQGADANGGDSIGAPLATALEQGYFTIAGILVQNGADVNAEIDGISLLDTLNNLQSQADSQVDEARYQLAIDWLYDNGANRPPE